MSHFARLFGTCWIFGAVLAVSTLGAAPRRWAIVADPAARESGLADLLAARLSERDGVELVERDRLDLALRELKLSACLGPEAAGERLRLGRLLGADRLLLLALEESESGKFLRLVISDADYGARLRSDSLSYDADELETLCDQCAKRLRATGEQFAGGVRYLIGAPPFLSKNLTHEHDHLQFGYAALLANSLSRYPGVAVVEVEEARAIRRELNLSGDELKGRIVPLFVEGEFKMTADAEKDSPAVHFSIRISDGENEPRQIEQTAPGLAAAANWLRGPLPRRIVHLAEDDHGAALSRSQQKEFLAKRAESFARLGSFEEAVALREAALLLDPDDVSLRLDLIGGYLRRYGAITHSWNLQYREMLQRRDPAHAAAERKALDARRIAQKTHWFHCVAEHLEYLLNDRALNPTEAAELLIYVRVKLLPYRKDPDHEKQTDELRDFVRDFFWRVYLQFPKLNPRLRDGRLGLDVQRALRLNALGARTPLRQYCDWTSDAINDFAHYIPLLGGPDRQGRKALGRRALNDLYRFLTQVADPQVPLRGMTILLAESPPSSITLHGMVPRGFWGREDLMHFYERLIKTGRPVNVYYGRLGQLASRVYLERDEKPDAKTLEKVDDLRERVGELCEVIGMSDWAHEHYLNRFRAEIVRRMREAPGARPGPKERSAAGSHPAFELVEGLRPNWRGLTKCTDSLDIMWSKQAVYVMSERGVARTIFEIDKSSKSKDAISSAHWDGQSVWVATRRSGIYVIALDGETRGHIAGNEGLPPYDVLASSSRRALHLHPIGPDRCVAFGQFGKNGRLWFALIEKERNAASSFRARVFHTATTVYRGASDGPDNDPNEIFDPSWLVEYSPPQTSERLLLIGRQNRLPMSADHQSRGPLAINLKACEVSVFPVEIDSLGYTWDPRYVFDGHILYACGEGLLLFSPPSGDRKDWRRTELVEIKIRRKPKLNPRLLIYRGQIYNPAGQKPVYKNPYWRRIDPKTWQVERLNDEPLPNSLLFQHYAVSAHYGVVGWSELERRRVFDGHGVRLDHYPEGGKLYQILPDKLAE